MRKLLIIAIGILLGSPLISPARAQQTSTTPTQQSAPPNPSNDAPPKTTPTTSAEPGSIDSILVPGLDSEKAKVSYAIGMSIAANFKKQSIEVDDAAFAKGFRDVLSGAPLLTDEQAHAILNAYQAEMRVKAQEKQRLAAENNKQAGEAFLKAIQSREGVVVLPSGLQYKILSAGTGPKPAATDTVICNYRGTLIDGTEFDSSAKHGGPATFPVSGVIHGWTEALQLMPVGSKWQLFIPPHLAYAERGAPGGQIGPNSTLVFEVELVSIKPKPEPAQPAGAAAAPPSSPTGAAPSGAKAPATNTAPKPQ
jgi:FKBP-type peptidyl-prolyl cis-trans isomerase FklB